MADEPTYVDAVPRAQPALSTTSDMPVIDLAKPPAPEPDAPADAGTRVDGAEPTDGKPAADAAPPGDDAPAGDGEGDGKARSPRGFEIERQRLNSQLDQERRQAAKLAEALNKAQDTIKSLAPDRVQDAEPAPEPKPQRDTFTDPDAYEAALIEWASNQAADQVEKRLEAKRKTETDQQAAQERQKANDQLVTTYRERSDAFAKDHADYAEVTGRDDIEISMAMSHAILNSERGPDLAYYLGKNPDEAARIAALDPTRAVLELGRLEAKLSAPAQTPRLQPKPDPIRPLGSTSPAANFDPNEASMDDYAAHRFSDLYGGKPPAALLH